MIKLNLSTQVYKSRRGDYRLATFPPTIGDANLLVWLPSPLKDTDRDIDVIAEVKYAQEGRLADHPYWKDEPIEFVNEYSKFYVELFGLKWLHEKDDRHNIVVNSTCCLTLVQYNNGILHAYSRSTDMRNGYFSDRILLNYLAEVINEMRPDCEVEAIQWYLAVPHVYVNKGIARLQEGNK
jgi:hypothetical protein